MRFTDLAAQSLLVAYALAKPIGSPVELEKRAVTKVTSCTEVSTVPSPVGFICGQEGHIERVGTSLFSWAAGTAVTDCQNECLATAECLTYSWNNTELMCRYYDKTIRGSNFKVGATDTYFWNKHCFMKSCAVSTSTLPVIAKSTTAKSTTIKSTTTAKTSTTKSASSSLAHSTTTSSTLSSSTSSTKSSSSLHSSPTSSSTQSTTSTKAATTSTKKATTSAKAATTSTKKATTSAKAATTSTKKAGITTSTTAAAAVSTCTVPSLDTSACTSISESLTGEVLDYALYYSGAGFTENPNNPANTAAIDLIAQSVTYPSTQTACEAAQNCAAQATLLGLLNLYESFDLHFSDSSCEWECNIYAGTNTNTEYFSVDNSSIVAAFGYSGTVTVDLSISL